MKHTIKFDMHTKKRQGKGSWRKMAPVFILALLLLGGGAWYFSGFQQTGGAGADNTTLASPEPMSDDLSAAATDELLPPEAAPSGEVADADTSPADELASAGEDEDLAVFSGVIGKGDTVGNILKAWVTPAEIHTLSQACKSVHSLSLIRLGQPYFVHSQGDDFVRFEYEIDNDTRLVIVRDGDNFTASREEIHYDIVLHRAEGRIASSLFNAMLESGEKAQLAVSLADVFAWEINFIRDLRVGDSFTLLVEKRYRDGEFKGYGHLLAASFVNQGTTYEAFRFTDDAGHSQYFNAQGDSLRRAFLKAPLSFTRISSGYSNRRLHPVTMDWKAHPAIDYAAPTGTPVKAVGKGEVTFKGYSKSAGNYISVKHLNGYETMYLHLSSFAKGLQKGSKVGQGQVIGFVGQTGYATGPHLDFRMKKDGSYVNPLKQLSPRDNPVTAGEMPRFTAQQDICREFLEDRRSLAEYSRKLISEL